jgi:hypothetical protein
MSEENFPEKIIVDKLTLFGEALQGSLVDHGEFPPNFPGKKIADKIDELIMIVQGEEGGFALRSELEAEAAAREAYDQQQDTKIQALNGHYYPIESYDFGKTLNVNNPDDVVILNTYAMTIEGVSDLAQIIEGTVIKNLFDGVEFVWNAVSQVWLDWDVGNIVTAGNDHLGVVEGPADPGDGTKDGFITVHLGGTMKTIGFDKKVDKVTHVNRVYATDGSGNPTSYTLSKEVYEDTVAWRGPGGRTKVGAPVDNADAATKKYVDDLLGNIDAALDLINGEAE